MLYNTDHILLLSNFSPSTSKVTLTLLDEHIECLLDLVVSAVEVNAEPSRVRPVCQQRQCMCNIVALANQVTSAVSSQQSSQMQEQEDYEQRWTS